MSDIYKRAAGAARYIRQRVEELGKICVITGSGLETILSQYTLIERFPFSKIPHLNEATFHRGEFLVLESKGKRFCALSGRLHYYEGYSTREVGFPIRILKLLGISHVVMTNAAGGLNPNYQPSEVILVKDHINLLPENPLRGENDERFGPRFPDMSNAYDDKFRNSIKTICAKLEIPIKEGVYACFQGPSLETPAEYFFLNKIGADLVGMSTVPEVIVANHCGMTVSVLSVVTNVCFPLENIKPTTVEDVITVAQKATPVLSRLVNEIINTYNENLASDL